MCEEVKVMSTEVDRKVKMYIIKGDWSDCDMKWIGPTFVHDHRVVV